MTQYQIKNLQDLILPILGKNQKFVEAKIINLTEVGDNYGSLMLSVDVTIEDDQNQTDCLHLVAKMLPQKEYMQKMFHSEVTFRNEIGFYQTIFPCVRELQEEQGFDELFEALPTFYGARISLDHTSSKVDGDAVLLIKNITEEGFVNIDKTVGFDKNQTELILKKLAELHASVFALKALKPEVFQEKLSQFFEEFSVFNTGKDSLAVDKVRKVLTDIVKDDEFCSHHLDKIEETINNVSLFSGTKNDKKLQNGPFLTFVHGDLWSNNIMVKIVNNETVNVKFVDFQIYEYASSVKDVIFFLFTSVEFSVIQQHCDELLLYYYYNFTNYLRKLKCDTSAFSLEIFLKEIKDVSKKREFFHIMLMLGPIYTKKEDLTENMGFKEMMDPKTNISELHKKKACFITQEFIRRNWI